MAIDWSTFSMLANSLLSSQSLVVVKTPNFRKEERDFDSVQNTPYHRRTQSRNKKNWKRSVNEKVPPNWCKLFRNANKCHSNPSHSMWNAFSFVKLTIRLFCETATKRKSTAQEKFGPAKKQVTFLAFFGHFVAVILQPDIIRHTLAHGIADGLCRFSVFGFCFFPKPFSTRTARPDVDFLACPPPSTQSSRGRETCLYFSQFAVLRQQTSHKNKVDFFFLLLFLVLFRCRDFYSRRLSTRRKNSHSQEKKKREENKCWPNSCILHGWFFRCWSLFGAVFYDPK